MDLCSNGVAIFSSFLASVREVFWCLTAVCLFAPIFGFRNLDSVPG